jgi:hypothetical protein
MNSMTGNMWHPLRVPTILISHPIHSHTSDCTSRHASIVPEAVDELENISRSRHRDFKKCDPLR